MIVAGRIANRRFGRQSLECRFLDHGGGAGGPPRAVGDLGSGGGGNARHLAAAGLRACGARRAARAPARGPRTDPAPPLGADAGGRAMTSPGSAGRADIDPLVVSVAEAARMLGISKTLAYGLVARQELPSVRVGGRVRVPRRALERLAEGRREGARVLPTGDRSAAPRRHRPPRPAPGSQTGGGPASPPPSGPDQSDSDSTTQLSLFECASESPSPTKTRTRTKYQTTTRMNTTKPSRTPTETTSTLPVSTTSTPDPYLLLTRSNQPDALAPGVRRGPVNVPGSGAGERSGLNGKLIGEAGSPC